MRDFLLANYLSIKSLHIIAVIAWMAGMMYLPRLFIYHFDAERGGEAERLFVVMERRLFLGIVNPSIVAVWLLAGLMLYARPDIVGQGWFMAKLPLVLGISAIHGLYSRARKAFARGERPRSVRFWKIVNEIPFILMIAAVFLAVVEPF